MAGQAPRPAWLSLDPAAAIRSVIALAGLVYGVVEGPETRLGDDVADLGVPDDLACDFTSHPGAGDNWILPPATGPHPRLLSTAEPLHLCSGPSFSGLLTQFATVPSVFGQWGKVTLDFPVPPHSRYRMFPPAFHTRQRTFVGVIPARDRFFQVSILGLDDFVSRFSTERQITGSA